MMKKGIFFLMAVTMAMLLVAGASYAWQGRMSGMASPYGLTPDDSDFLIHPSLITRGEGFDVYSNFDFIYTDIYKWDFENNINGSFWKDSYNSSGDQYNYDALLGVAFQLGTGRMGVFFEYEGMERDIDGDAEYPDSSTGPDLSNAADYDPTDPRSPR